ncbi:hypothetical protein OS493_006666 [Desmophyllum pertusum]|uniref:Solute carrier family 23 member 2 n=1 Tax=Desmophyllum pertusum TaxID=174260 RepID=A0A9W9ZRW2_9CNID|nr:hypothetical protein OS493_006666 [Desmophyllum pertusum]
MEIQIAEPGTQPPPNKKIRALGLSYLINENPPWYICLLLGFQHFLTMLGAILAIPFFISGPMCFANNTLAISEVLSTIFFVSGIVTFLQSSFGVRLPIVQGGTASFLIATFAVLSLPQWACPKPEETFNSTESSFIYSDEIWQPRMREIQGAIMVSSLFQIVIGFTGLIGFLLRFIGPLTIAPTLTLIGLALFRVAADHAGNHWGILMTTIALIALFSQYLTNVKIPVPGYSKSRGGCYISHYPFFRLFPIILAIAVSWIICAIVTAAGGFPSDPSIPRYKARTDARTAVLKEAKWFRFPYPGQWGTPTVSAAGVFGMLAGVLATIIESVGNYYACARLSGAPPPPKHAINRGIGIQGIGCLLAGAFGSGNGTTSYCENIGVIGITKVASRRVVQYCAVVVMTIGVFGTCSLFSIVFGLALPHYMEKHPNAIETGVSEIDQILTVLFRTSMAIGCIVAFILNNTIPGTIEEHGLKAWRQHLSDESDEQFQTASIKVYEG